MIQFVRQIHHDLVMVDHGHSHKLHAKIQQNIMMLQYLMVRRNQKSLLMMILVKLDSRQEVLATI
jgi:predicted unusual protein kinase regulating ubiquinone biosynthesis (AarF/ABC1/UbiB family)